MKRTLKAFAKINLMLDVTGVKKNGYHKLYTVMQNVDLADTITVERTAGDTIVVSCTEPSVPTDRHNIVYKCTERFFSETGIKPFGVKIHIEKVIPSQAGMGGGSADGAAVLKALNSLCDNCVGEKDLLEIGAKVGADIPFIMVGGTALCLDIGSVIAPLPNLENVTFVIVRPEVGSSTDSAYGAVDSAEFLRHPKGEAMVEALLEKDSEEAFRYCDNLFEQVIEVPGRVDIKEIMRKCGAMNACMTGSGSAVFGVFRKSKDAEKCGAELRKNYSKVYVCGPKDCGVEFIDEN